MRVFVRLDVDYGRGCGGVAGGTGDGLEDCGEWWGCGGAEFREGWGFWDVLREGEGERESWGYPSVFSSEGEGVGKRAR